MSRSTGKAQGAPVADVESELLRHVLLDRGPSRADLARRLGIAPSTVTIYVERLKAKGFLLESPRMMRKHGRWPTLLRPNPAAGCFIGVDFEASSLMTTVLDFSLAEKRRHRESIPAGESVAGILTRIEHAIHQCLKEQESPLLGVGVGVPGMVDSAGGVVTHYKFLPEWRNVPVGPWLAGRFNVPVHVEGNVRAMALAELWLGQGRDVRNFVCLGVRTGIGMSFVLNGELFTGYQGGAGEIGSWTSVAAGRSQSSPTLDAVASLPGIYAAALSATRKNPDFAGLLTAVRAGDPAALRAIERAAAFHGAALRHVHLLLEPQRIIVVGPLAELGSALLEPLVAGVGGQFDGAPPKIVLSTFGEFGGALGAATLAVHRWKLNR